VDLIAELYDKSDAAAFEIDLEQFRQVLEGIGHRSGELESLKIEDLALAQGCARGNDAAWERFAARYGGRLRTIALSITREESSARDLAGSLYADLFGSRKLLSYSGRGSLEGWLRAVMAQEHINWIRASQRLTSYEAAAEFGAVTDRHPSDEHLAAAVDAALCILKSEERFLLASYYLDGRTLAEIARTLHVHESTVSRRMEKLVVKLRKQTIKELRRRGVTGAAAEELLGSDVRDIEVDVGRHLMEAPPSRSGARE
jgi:RNA polymerase sigma-70 factor (ECF subfamily)